MVEADIYVDSAPVRVEVSAAQGPARDSVHVGATPPANPTIGKPWYDDEDGIFAIWDGTAWVGQEFLPIPAGVPALAFTAPGGEPFTYLGEYFTAPA